MSLKRAKAAAFHLAAEYVARVSYSVVVLVCCGLSSCCAQAWARVHLVVVVELQYIGKQSSV